MARRHFKQKQYGKVKPVKKVEEVVAKPQTIDLRFHYRGVASANDAEVMDHVAAIVRWYENLVIWQQGNKKKFPLTTTQAKLITDGARLKREAQASTTKQFELFVKHIEVMEKYATNLVNALPKIKEVMVLRKEKTKKIQVQVERIAPRFEKLVTLLHSMFPASGFSVEVVPRIQLNDKELSWKYDHQLSRIYYSRKRAIEMVKTIRKEGILRVALHEAFTIARAQSFVGVKDGNYVINDAAMVVNVEKLLHGVVDWALKGPKPKKLVRIVRPKKEKKEVAA